MCMYPMTPSSSKTITAQSPSWVRRDRYGVALLQGFDFQPFAACCFLCSWPWLLGMPFAHPYESSPSESKSPGCPFTPVMCFLLTCWQETRLCLSLWTTLPFGCSGLGIESKSFAHTKLDLMLTPQVGSWPNWIFWLRKDLVALHKHMGDTCQDWGFPVG